MLISHPTFLKLSSSLVCAHGYYRQILPASCSSSNCYMLCGQKTIEQQTKHQRVSNKSFTVAQHL
jgi:hypothetical protein